VHQETLLAHMEDYLWIATSNKLPQLHSTVTVVPTKKSVSSFMLKLTLRRSRCGSEVRLKTPPSFMANKHLNFIV